LRLLGGIVLVVIAFVLVLASPLATFYHVHTVGPDFRTVGPDGPTDEDETRQLDGEWTLTGYQLSNITWDRDMNAWERDWDQYSFYGEGSDIVNERGRKVYVETGAALVAGVVALGLGSFGIWNVARRLALPGGGHVRRGVLPLRHGPPGGHVVRLHQRRRELRGLLRALHRPRGR